MGRRSLLECNRRRLVLMPTCRSGLGFVVVAAVVMVVRRRSGVSGVRGFWVIGEKGKRRNWWRIVCERFLCSEVTPFFLAVLRRNWVSFFGLLGVVSVRV